MLRSLRQQEVKSAVFAGSPLLPGLVDDRQSVFPHLVGNDRYHPDLSLDGFGLWGFVIMMLSHWLCDFSWSYFSRVIVQGRPVFGKNSNA